MLTFTAKELLKYGRKNYNIDTLLKRAVFDKISDYIPILLDKNKYPNHNYKSYAHAEHYQYKNQYKDDDIFTCVTYWVECPHFTKLYIKYDHDNENYKVSFCNDVGHNFTPENINNWYGWYSNEKLYFYRDLYNKVNPMCEKLQNHLNYSELADKFDNISLDEIVELFE